MKKIITILLLSCLTTFAFSQKGTIKYNNVFQDSISQIDLSDGDTAIIIYLSKYKHTCTWNVFLHFTDLTGTIDGTASVYESTDEGVSWASYPNMEIQTITTDTIPYNFDDNYTAYDQIKIPIKVNGITGGTLTYNIRIFSNPKK